MKSSLAILLLLCLSWEMKGQQSPAKDNSIAITADFFSGGISYTRKFNNMLQPGVSIGVGYSFIIYYYVDSKWNYTDLQMIGAKLQLFNRFEPSNSFYFDAGAGYGKELFLKKIDDERKKGDGPYIDLWYGYLNPMIGGKHFKAGFQVGVGSNGRSLLFTSLPMVQYRILF